MELELSSIRIGSRHRKDLGDIELLSKSIQEVGLLHPIVVTPQRELIAGERRLAALKKLGWERAPVRFVDIKAIALGELAENYHRKDFTPSEMVSIGEAVESFWKEKARAAQVEAGARGQEGAAHGAEGGRGRKKLEEYKQLAAKKREEAARKDDSKPVEEKPPLSKFYKGGLREPDPIRATAQVAKAVGTSHTTYEKIKAVVRAAREKPKEYLALKEEMDRTGRVDGVFKKLKVAEQAENIRSEPPPLPKGPFRVIVADPPWQYSNRADDASHRVANPYPSMGIEAIKAMRISDIAHEDCILWLWTTNAHIREAFSVAESWGFEYKTILTWVKNQMGTGDWLRGKTEHCLLCVRGKPTIQLTNQTTAIEAPRGRHSEKPEEFYGVVEKMCPGSKVEIFSRKSRPGWEVFGDEIAPNNRSDRV